MIAAAPTRRAALSPGDLTLACALVDARREAARANRVCYVYADGSGAWVGPADQPPRRQPYYRVYPGGHIEHHHAPQSRRRI
jgi:hypothetical protein